MKKSRQYFFFSIKDLDFTIQKIYGTYFNGDNGRFEERLFPYPDILYDRGGGTLKSQKRKSRAIRKEIDKNSKPLKINPKYYFDKWDVYKKLAEKSKISSYLSKTILYRSQSDLLSMLELYSTIYVKDCLGHNSAGVAKIKKFSDNNFELLYYRKEIFTKNFNSFDDLQSEMSNLFRGKEAIIQAAIDIIEIDGCNMDMRAEVQRNEKNEIEIGPYMVRIGGKNSHVTNTKSGGMVYLFDNVFKNKLNFSDEEVIQIKSRIENFLLTTFEAIEDVYGTFGELGIDFALDKYLNIWFIECNAKPGKDTIYLAGNDEDVHKSFLNPLNYGKFLWENRRLR